MNDYPILRLGEIVKPVQDRMVDRTKWDFERYIAGEHIDSGEVRIRKYGLIKGNEEVIGSAFHMRFRPGHVLYSTRRAYLRKAGMVNFEGICSNITLVLQANEEKLLQSLLPFILQSEDFVQFAISHSIGSTNPFVKWTDLSKYKIRVPPISIQNKMSQMLWAVEDNIEKTEILIQVSEKLKKGLLEELLTKGIGHKKFKKTELGEIPEDWSIASLGEICEERKDRAYPPYKKQKYVSLEQMHSADLIQNTFAESQSVQSVTNKFLTGDLLYGKLRPNLDKAAIANFDGICSTEILVINSKPSTSNNYLLLHFKSKPFVEYNSNGAYGTKMPRTSFEILSKYKIPIGSVEEQDMILAVVNSLNTFESNCRKQTEELANLEKKLANLFLSGELLIPKEDMN